MKSDILACVVRECDSTRKATKFTFPKDENIGRLWLEAVKSEFLNQLSYEEIRKKKYNVCHLHFPAHAYYKTGNGKHRLIWNMVPSLNLGLLDSPDKENNALNSMPHPGNAEESRDCANIQVSVSETTLSTSRIILDSPYSKSWTRPDEEHAYSRLPPSQNSEECANYANIRVGLTNSTSSTLMKTLDTRQKRQYENSSLPQPQNAEESRDSAKIRVDIDKFTSLFSSSSNSFSESVSSLDSNSNGFRTEAGKFETMFYGSSDHASFNSTSDASESVQNLESESMDNDMKENDQCKNSESLMSQEIPQSELQSNCKVPLTEGKDRNYEILLREKDQLLEKREQLLEKQREVINHLKQQLSQNQRKMRRRNTTYQKVRAELKQSQKLIRRMSKMSGIQKTFLQMMAENKNSKRKFTPEEKAIALSIYKKSKPAYRHQRHIFNLPSESTLKSFQRDIKIQTGINECIKKQLQDTVQHMEDLDKIG